MKVINISNRKVIYEQYKKEHPNVDKTNIFIQKLLENNIFK